MLGALALAACGGGKSSPSAVVPGNDGGTGGGDTTSPRSWPRRAPPSYKVTYQSGSDKPFTIAQDPPKFSYVQRRLRRPTSTADGTAVELLRHRFRGDVHVDARTATSIKQSLASSFGAIGALFVTRGRHEHPRPRQHHQTTSKKIAGRDAVCATIDKDTLGALGVALGAAIGTAPTRCASTRTPV